MNINFNEVTYECLKFLATKEGKSVAAYVAQLMDEHTGQMVNLTFTMNEVPAEARIIQHDEKPYVVDSFPLYPKGHPKAVILPSDRSVN